MPLDCGAGLIVRYIPNEGSAVVNKRDFNHLHIRGSVMETSSLVGIVNCSQRDKVVFLFFDRNLCDLP